MLAKINKNNTIYINNHNKKYNNKNIIMNDVNYNIKILDKL